MNKPQFQKWQLQLVQCKYYVKKLKLLLNICYNNNIIKKKSIPTRKGKKENRHKIIQQEKEKKRTGTKLSNN